MLSAPAVPLLLLALTLSGGATQDADPGIPADKEIQTTPSGLRYSVLEPGQGPSPKPGVVVTVHYSGWLPDGTPFDSSVKRGEPFEFQLGQGGVIKGWDEGVALMRKGARYKLTIPPELGYGEQGSPPVIPVDSWLVFEIQLLDFPILPEFRPGNPAAQQKLESGLVWELITPGEGEPLSAGSTFSLRFALWNGAGKMLDCTERNKQTLVAPLGQAPLKFLNEMVPLMKPGARVRVEVPSALAFDKVDKGPDLPPNSLTIWELELVPPLPLPEFAPNDPQSSTTTASGLWYQVLRPGTGKTPKLKQFVTVHYAGWLTDGTLFDASFTRGEPAVFQLGRVIPGWNEGLQLMQEGAIYRFTIPANLAYGPRGSPPAVPPNATLVFHVELVKVGR